MSLLKKNNPLAEYPCADYLHNALRFLTERKYAEAYSEVCWAIIKSGGKLSAEEYSLFSDTQFRMFSICNRETLKPLKDYPYSICPRCGGSIDMEDNRVYVENGKISYCNHCGQALDWSVDDDEP